MIEVFNIKTGIIEIWTKTKASKLVNKTNNKSNYKLLPNKYKAKGL